MMEKHSSAWRQQSAAGCGVGGLEGSRACAPSSAAAPSPCLHHLLPPSAAGVTVTSIRLLPRMSACLTAEPKSWPHPPTEHWRGAGGGRYHLSVTTCPACSGGSTAKRWPWSPCIAITYPEISNSTSKVSGKFRYSSCMRRVNKGQWLCTV